MQNDDTTVFSFGERADELMTALSAAGLRGMMTIDEAMTMLKLSRFNQLAYALGVSDSIIKRWRSNGFIHPKQVKKIRALYRGMGVAA